MGGLEIVLRVELGERAEALLGRLASALEERNTRAGVAGVSAPVRPSAEMGRSRPCMPGGVEASAAEDPQPGGEALPDGERPPAPPEPPPAPPGRRRIAWGTDARDAVLVAHYPQGTDRDEIWRMLAEASPGVPMPRTWQAVLSRANELGLKAPLGRLPASLARAIAARRAKQVAQAAPSPATAEEDGPSEPPAPAAEEAGGHVSEPDDAIHVPPDAHAASGGDDERDDRQPGGVSLAPATQAPCPAPAAEQGAGEAPAGALPAPPAPPVAEPPAPPPAPPQARVQPEAPRRVAPRLPAPSKGRHYCSFREIRDWGRHYGIEYNGANIAAVNNQRKLMGLLPVVQDEDRTAADTGAAA